MARMRILTANEQQTFDRPPLFDHRDRNKYFDLPKSLMDIAKSLAATSSEAGWHDILEARSVKLQKSPQAPAAHTHFHAQQTGGNLAGGD